MCHQAIEKILKAYFVKSQNQTPPFSHSLSLLAKKSGLFTELTEIQKDFIDQIEPLNIEARYPSQKERLLKSLSKIKCSEILKKTRELHECLIKKL
jgi:HEPN domain-containing protein